MGYGKQEFIYAAPFAEALVNDFAFRSWVLRKTRFAEFADEAVLLHRQMWERRSAGTQTWWRSHYQEACRCIGCRGQETDLLAIFEAKSGLRFALHVEVKHPTDKFKDEIQALSYPVRAACWVAKAPKHVLPHAGATTALLFSDTKREEFAPYLKHFAALYTFECIRQRFPNATPRCSHRPQPGRRPPPRRG